MDVTPDGALEGAFVSAIEDANEGSSEGSPKVVPGDLYTVQKKVRLRLKLRGHLRY